ncbi:hypothetical protein FIBSPDRAFT_874762 [Athelia psychrophila]|uniref:Uncharacterized protein n=1 Tax=Athelia psychrophila TaxID=1759441 RepID=A0A165X4K0_9AGAM|nr:hypothetical protein FIBSPDRAFT_874762 [Fibularhizoctonia sp. CBS 109695]
MLPDTIGCGASVDTSTLSGDTCFRSGSCLASFLPGDGGGDSPTGMISLWEAGASDSSSNVALFSSAMAEASGSASSAGSSGDRIRGF